VASVHLPLMTYEPSDCDTLIAYKPLELWRIYNPRAPSTYDALMSHDLLGLGLSAQTAGRAQHDEPH
jgi:hypothetical protein